MDFLLVWLHENMTNLVIAVSTLVGIALIMVLLMCLFGITVRLSQWVTLRRLAHLRIVAEHQSLALQIKRRSQDDGRLVEENRALLASGAAAARREEDLRRLHASLEENLTARSARFAALEEELERANDGIAEQAEIMEGMREESNDQDKRQKKADRDLESLRGELAQRDQVISMLESQVNTQTKAAAMANAGMDDLNAKVAQLTDRNALITEQLTMFKQLYATEQLPARQG